MSTEFDLMVAPNGARLQKSDHPSLPITQEEIVATATVCEAVGATSIHMHIRDQNAAHSLDPDQYNTTLKALEQTCGLNLQISTEAASIFDVATQYDCLNKVATNDASVALREVEPDPNLFAKLYQMADQRRISVQHILYSEDEVTRLLRYFDEGKIPQKNRRALFVIGRYRTGQQSEPSDLAPFLSHLGNEDLNWAVCAFGRNEHDCLMAALDQGGDVRIGFENNRLTATGEPFASNQASVATFVARARGAGFEPQRGMQ